MPLLASRLRFYVAFVGAVERLVFADGGPHTLVRTAAPASPASRLPRLPLHMIDREKVLAVLRKRFPTGTPQQFAAAANAIVGLGDEWEDVTGHEPELGYHASVQCADICYIADQVQRGAEFRLLRRREGDS